MSELDNNELDNYGVWVKKPPRTVDSSSDNTDEPFGSFDISTDLPDFSSLDENTENTTTAEETMSENKSEEDILNGQEEEISLDEFITDGVFETGPDEDKIREKEAEKAAAAQNAPEEEPEETASEDVSLDTFTETTPFVSEDAPAAEEQQAPVIEDDDDTLNIDLSFDDSDTPVAEETVSADSFTTEETQPSDDGSESVDLSEFGIDEFTDPNPGAENASSGTDTEASGSFDDLFNSDTPAETPSESSSDEESVDIADFGVDFSDADSAEDKTVGDEEEPVISDESDSEASFKIDMEENEEPVAQEAQTSTFAQENDSDFDVDDILNSAQDETGKTVTVGSQEDALVKEVADIPETDIPEETAEPEIQSETIEEFSPNPADSLDIDSAFTDIPDTFDEETASLTTDELTNIASSVTSTQTAEDFSADIMPESEPAPQEDSTTVANSILQDIVGQLNSLKTEISSLKTDFEQLKNNNAVASPLPQNIAAKQEEEDSGFFSEDGDDTIALSTDELNNILTTSEITEESGDAEAGAEPAETSDSLLGEIDNSIDVSESEYENDNNLTMDFSNENLVEPDLDDLDMKEDEISSELPDDISIPKVDDILVDSSSTDLMESIADSTENTTEEVETAEAEEVPLDLADSDADDTITDADKSFEDIFAPDPSISDSLTEEKLNYLENDENSAAENEISDASSELKTEDTVTGNESSIPGELKTEIKSVLSYMDQLLENLPEEKIAEFAQSEQFETYKKLFKELGLS